MADNDDRRYESIERMARLEERTAQNQAQLKRIEDMLVVHAKEEESVLRDIHNGLSAIKEKMESRIHEVVAPIETKVNALNEKWGRLAWLAGGLMSIFVLFKDQILRLLGIG